MALTQEQIDVLNRVIFIAESVAHMQGKEREILPDTDKARDIVHGLQIELNGMQSMGTASILRSI